MTVAASLLSLVLFLAFASAGAQRLVFNPAMSKSAEHLGYTRRAYRRVGLLEVVGAIALLIGLTARGTTALAVVNEVAAAGLALLMAIAVSVHLRKHDALKYYAPALSLGLLAILELIFRLV